jgi:PAS domain S-box-containing protein
VADGKEPGMHEERSYREQIERRLRATEERFRLAQAAIGIGWFEWDLATNEWESTPPVAALFGFDPAAPRRSFAEWQAAIFVDDAPKLQAAVELASRTGAYYVEFRVTHPDGRVHWIAGKGEASRDETGRARWIAGVYADISERKQLEARLLSLNETLEARVAEIRELNQTLEHRVLQEINRRQDAEEALRQAQKLEAIGQLTGGVAHDFNNLLTVIIGNLEHLERGLRDSSHQRIVAAALRGASRAAMLTERLLAFSRRQPLAPQVVSVNKLVAGMSDLLRRTIGEAVRVETVLAGGVWPAFVDSNQLENALINLAVNARDAMPAGGKLTIETANSHLDEAYARMHGEVEPGQYVGLFVTDTGTGMSEDVVAHAFEPFFTTKETGQGTGLGLSQIYGFIKQSGGHVKIYSEVGQGTTMKLYLPRHRGPEIAADEERETRELPRGRFETVLVVEDDPDVRDYTVEIVGDLGYRVLSAEDGASALRLLDAHREVRLLFTDVGLPGGMNGRQLADRALRRQPRLKVLYTTGYARNAIVHQGRLDPGVEVVLKPFTYSELAGKLRRVLDG